MAYAKKSRRNRNKSATASRTAPNYFLNDLLALAETLAERKKEWGAERISDVAEATREFAAAMEQIPNLDNYINAAANSLEVFSDYLRKTDFERIVADASSFARRHPVLVVTGGAIAGLAAVQVLRSGPTISNLGGRTKSSKRRSGARRMRRAAAGGSSRSNGHAHLNS